MPTLVTNTVLNVLPKKEKNTVLNALSSSTNSKVSSSRNSFFGAERNQKKANELKLDIATPCSQTTELSLTEEAWELRKLKYYRKRGIYRTLTTFLCRGTKYRKSTSKSTAPDRTKKVYQHRGKPNNNNSFGTHEIYDKFVLRLTLEVGTSR